MNLTSLCEESIITPDISGVGYMKCFTALPLRCKDFKRETIAAVRNNGNKLMLFLRSANYRLGIAVTKGGEETSGKKIIYLSCKRLSIKQESEKLTSVLLSHLPDV